MTGKPAEDANKKIGRTKIKPVGAQTLGAIVEQEAARSLACRMLKGQEDQENRQAGTSSCSGYNQQYIADMLVHTGPFGNEKGVKRARADDDRRAQHPLQSENCWGHMLKR